MPGTSWLGQFFGASIQCTAQESSLTLTRTDSDWRKHLAGYSPLVLPLGLSLIVCVAGCQESATQRLLGRWEGRQDSAKARAERWAAAMQTGSVPATENADPTDLEQIEVAITLDFQSEGKIDLWRGEGQERLAGTWKVLDVVGDTARVQIVVRGEDALADGAPSNNEFSPTGEAGSQEGEVRNFEIEFDESSAGQGFTLNEEGADPQFGQLYFQRVGG